MASATVPPQPGNQAEAATAEDQRKSHLPQEIIRQASLATWTLAILGSQLFATGFASYHGCHSPSSFGGFNGPIRKQKTN
jgi:hypothetical protein